MRAEPVSAAPVRSRVTGGAAWLAAAGAACAAVGIALAAYASHGVQGAPQAQLQAAALFALVHGGALAALAPLPGGRLRRAALIALLAGTLLFSGSVTAGALLGWTTAAAPFGGSLMIAAWLLLAADFLRR